MLKAENRLKKKSDFKKLAKGGRRYFSTFFIVYKKLNNDNLKRAGVVISNKVSKKAVVRNRIKRWIRNDIREKLQDLPNADYMVVVKGNVLSRQHQELRQDLHKLLEKISKNG